MRNLAAIPGLVNRRGAIVDGTWGGSGALAATVEVHRRGGTSRAMEVREMSTTKTPARPTTGVPRSIPMRVHGPGPAPGSSRSWLLISIAVTVLTAMVIAAVLWMAPGADTGSAGLATRGELAATARLEGQATAYEQARQARAEQAESARWSAQAEYYEQVRQARSNAAYTARLDGLADRALGR